jgi:hypothetical protein
MTSTVTIAPREALINDQKWIDSLHINSEVQNYYTRYLATIKDQIAILVTLTAHNSKYQKHATHFAETVKSLRVTATKDLKANASLGIGGADGGILGNNGQGGIDPGLLEGADENANKEGSGKLLDNPMVLGFLILILAVVAYVGIRIYQKKKNG